MKSYTLKSGKYFIGDISRLIHTNKKGTQFIESIWDELYDSNEMFLKISRKNNIFYLMRTNEGDGIYNGIGTDTGVIGVVDISGLKDSSIFTIPTNEAGYLIMDVIDSIEVLYKNGGLYFSNGFVIET